MFRMITATYLLFFTAAISHANSFSCNLGDQAYSDVSLQQAFFSMEGYSAYPPTAETEIEFVRSKEVFGEYSFYSYNNQSGGETLVYPKQYSSVTDMSQIESRLRGTITPDSNPIHFPFGEWSVHYVGLESCSVGRGLFIGGKYASNTNATYPKSNWSSQANLKNILIATTGSDSDEISIHLGFANNGPFQYNISCRVSGLGDILDFKKEIKVKHLPQELRSLITVPCDHFEVQESNLNIEESNSGTRVAS